MEKVSFDLVIEVLLFGGTLVGVYVHIRTKLKELDMRLRMMEERIKLVEKQDDKILEKLDAMTEHIMNIKVELQNKLNKSP